jgi:two-component system chemotaxis response regulator CheB|nr:chemotaxis response regulator protein-glutamate methylesterase [Kofleriaceae bacterium]
MIRVLVVDDSALMRRLLTELLGRDPEIEVVGAAQDPYVAREQIKALSPDVITLDVEMPRMDGLTFLRNLMRLRPMPVVMVSSLTERGADATLTALELGAIDFVAKPKLDVARGIDDLAAEIVAKVKIAARARPVALGNRPQPVARGPLLRTTTDRVIAIGASTGGTEAIARVLAQLPPDMPGIVIAQHIPPEFSRRFAERLHAGSALTVREASDGEPVLLGHVYVAPGARHLRIERRGARYTCAVGDDEPVNRHRPSVDVLMSSVAEHAGANAIGVMLTGMGADGADGLRAMRDRGATTIAQDRESSVVWGMPGEAVKRGGAGEVLPLDAVAARLVALTASSR